MKDLVDWPDLLKDPTLWPGREPEVIDALMVELRKAYQMLLDCNERGVAQAKRFTMMMGFSTAAWAFVFIFELAELFG